MRLATLVPQISSDLVIALENCGICTVEDLLFSSLIEIYGQLPVGSISLFDLQQLSSHVATLASASGTLGTELLRRQIEAHEMAPSLGTGVAELDDLLGGFGGCRVLEISGDTQSGKTV